MAVEYLNMSTVIELTVADNEHEDIAIVHAHQSYSGLGALGIWARRSRHGVAVRSVPGGNKTNRTIPQRLPDSCLDRYMFKESLYVTQALQAYAFEYDVMLYMHIYVTV